MNALKLFVRIYESKDRKVLQKYSLLKVENDGINQKPYLRIYSL